MPVPTVAFFWLRDFHSWATKCLPLRGFLRIALIVDSHMMMRFETHGHRSKHMGIDRTQGDEKSPH